MIDILTGPDRGKSFPLVDDLVRLGRGGDSHVVLIDPEMDEFPAAITRQGNRYELYTELSTTVTINGSIVPPQLWVSLPPLARIFLGGSTEIRLRDAVADPGPLPASSSVTVDVTADVPVGPVTTSSLSNPPVKRPTRKESKRQVAKLIPQSKIAEPVTLGQDGKYPELALTSTAAKPTTQRVSRESNPALLFTVLVASCLTSAGLLLVDFEGSGMTTRQTSSQARLALEKYYGNDSAKLEYYQKLLRQASISHSQGHRGEESQSLNRVLSLLNAVDTAAVENLNGLTGRQTGRGKAGDKELRELIEQILAGGD